MTKKTMLKRLQKKAPSLLATILGCLTLAGSPALCQLTTADVVGTVTDATGAIIPGAKITLVNLGTQIAQVSAIRLRSIWIMVSQRADSMRYEFVDVCGIANRTL